jgi:hypothetical protein
MRSLHLSTYLLNGTDRTGMSLKIVLQSAFSIDTQSSHACRTDAARRVPAQA